MTNALAYNGVCSIMPVKCL